MQQNLLYRLEILSRRMLPERLFHWRYQYIGTCPLLSSPLNSPSDLRFFFSTRDSMDERLHPGPTNPTITQQRFEAGHHALLALQNEELIGTAWFARHEYADLDTQCTFQLEPNEAWLYGAWVRRENRGRGVYAAMLQTASDLFRSKGIERFLFGVDWTNRVSLQAHKRFGATWIGTCFGARVLGLGGYRARFNRALAS